MSEKWYDGLNSVEVAMTQRDFDEDGQPCSFSNKPMKSKRAFFPLYSFENGISLYKGVEVGEGGYVYAKPGIYGNVALLDIASMHPHSAINMCLFGPKFTKRFADLVLGRIYIKHKDFDSLKEILDGKFMKYTNDEQSLKDLDTVLKVPINAVYGQTAAHYKNAFRHPDNVDNIVAKRGALFMVNLKEQVEKKGYTVVHIKTDSIKIADADDDIIKFVMEYGMEFGYTFEHEATYDRICLVNDAVYIARYNERGKINKGGKGALTWTPTGAEFAHPYVFKKLFSNEEITEEDKLEIKNVTGDGKMYIVHEDGKMDFVGKAGGFIPVTPTCPYGGTLMAFRPDKNTGEMKRGNVTGTKGYSWALYSDATKPYYDPSYHENKVKEAMDHIQEFGDASAFLDTSLKYDVPLDDDPPWDKITTSK